MDPVAGDGRSFELISKCPIGILLTNPSIYKLLDLRQLEDLVRMIRKLSQTAKGSVIQGSDMLLIRIYCIYGPVDET